jgi:hypothetical protein
MTPERWILLWWVVCILIFLGLLTAAYFIGRADGIALGRSLERKACAKLWRTSRRESPIDQTRTNRTGRDRRV